MMLARGLKVCPAQARGYGGHQLGSHVMRRAYGTTMKAAVVRKFKEPLVIENMPIPEPAPDQVLIRVRGHSRGKRGRGTESREKQLKKC